jgi:hypothetical protein
MIQWERRPGVLEPGGDMKRYGLAAVAVAAAVAAGTGPGQPPARGPHWRDVVAEKVPTFGQRNWIVVADAAFPAQTKPGVETVVARAGQVDVLRFVLDELAAWKHLTPVVHQDAELAAVPERDAPGIGDHRRELRGLLAEVKPRTAPHEDLLDRIDKAAEKYKVLVVKTDTMLPYTTVFLELDAGYWTADAERRLREALKGPGK